MYPIVLIHGFPLDASMWQPQIEHLRARGRTVIAPNLPGFGGTAALPLEEATIGMFAEHVHAIIEKEAGAKAIVGGFSMGGYVLLSLLREHPGSVAAAMFVDTRADADSTEARAARLKSIEEVQAQGPANLFETMVKRLLGKKPSAATQKQVRAIMERQSAAGIIAAQSAMSERRDSTELLAKLRLPVLILVGAEDVIMPPSVALAMQSHVPHAMVAQIVSAGHLTPLEQPGPVNTTIDAFLATVREPGGAKVSAGRQNP